MSNIRLPDEVQWSEGMLLSPQHLQQHEIYWHAQLNYRLLAANPHAWGLTELVFDSTRLAEGRLGVTRLACLMPDGLPIEFPGTYTQQGLSIDLASLCQDGKPVRVVLAVPQRGVSAKQRFDVLAGDEVLDELTGLGGVTVERLRPRLGLYVEEECPTAHVVCPLCEVVRNEQGAIVFTAYHPPMLRVGVSRFLQAQSLTERLVAVRNLLWEKLHLLSAAAGDEQGDDGQSLAPQLRQQVLQARTLAACAPELDVWAMDELAHPAAVYAVLARLVGLTTALGGKTLPLGLLPYAHRDCFPALQNALNFITARLGEIDTRFEVLPFARMSEASFARRLPSRISGALIIELRPREGQSMQDLNRWLLEARVGSEEIMPVLYQRRLPGASTRLLTPREINDLGLRREGLYFVVLNRQLELPPQGLVDAFRGGRALLIQGAATTQCPAAILLHHRMGQFTPQGEDETDLPVLQESAQHA